MSNLYPYGNNNRLFTKLSTVVYQKSTQNTADINTQKAQRSNCPERKTVEKYIEDFRNGKITLAEFLEKLDDIGITPTITNGDKTIISFTDSDGKRYIINANSNGTKYNYNDDSYESKIVITDNPDGTKCQSEYDKDGNLLSIKLLDANGNENNSQIPMPDWLRSQSAKDELGEALKKVGVKEPNERLVKKALNSITKQYSGVVNKSTVIDTFVNTYIAQKNTYGYYLNQWLQQNASGIIGECDNNILNQAITNITKKHTEDYIELDGNTDESKEFLAKLTQEIKDEYNKLAKEAEESAPPTNPSDPTPTQPEEPPVNPAPETNPSDNTSVKYDPSYKPAIENPNSKFENPGEMMQWLNSDECKNNVFAQFSGITDADFRMICGKAYGDFVTNVIGQKHMQDFANVTKTQLFNEIVATFKEYVDKMPTQPEEPPVNPAPQTDPPKPTYNSGYNPTFDNNHFSDINSMMTWINSDECKRSVFAKFSGINDNEFRQICGKSYGEFTSQYATKHQSDFAHLTKTALYNEIVTDFKKYADIPTQQEEPPVNPAPQNNPPVDSNTTELQQGLQAFKDKISEFLTPTEIKNFTTLYGKEVHTEFGIDKNGKIVFEDENTKNLYNSIIDNLVQDFANSRYYEVLKQIGGSEAEGKAILEKLIQAAWIMTYSDYPSSQKNNTENFVNKMIENLNKVLTKVIADPSKLGIYTQAPNYGTDFDNGRFTGYVNGNEKASGQTTINYGSGSTRGANDYILYLSGTDAQSNTTYRSAMQGVLTYLLDKYSSVPAHKIKNAFLKAQEKALEVCRNNTNDLPFGIGRDDNIKYGLEDHDGTNNRKGDNSKIFVSQLVQMVLYMFDRILYSDI